MKRAVFIGFDGDVPGLPGMASLRVPFQPPLRLRPCPPPGSLVVLGARVLSDSPPTDFHVVVTRPGLRGFLLCEDLPWSKLAPWSARGWQPTTWEGLLDALDPQVEIHGIVIKPPHEWLPAGALRSKRGKELLAAIQLLAALPRPWSVDDWAESWSGMRLRGDDGGRDRRAVGARFRRLCKTATGLTPMELILLLTRYVNARAREAGIGDESIRKYFTREDGASMNRTLRRARRVCEESNIEL